MKSYLFIINSTIQAEQIKSKNINSTVYSLTSLFN